MTYVFRCPQTLGQPRESQSLCRTETLHRPAARNRESAVSKAGENGFEGAEEPLYL